MNSGRMPIGFASTAGTKETVSSQVVLNLEDGKLISIQNVPEKNQQEEKTPEPEVEAEIGDESMSLPEVAAEFIARSASILGEAEDAALSINDAHSRSEMLSGIADKYMLYALSLLNGSMPVTEQQQSKNKQID